jgi:hypothetical protein
MRDGREESLTGHDAQLDRLCLFHEVLDRWQCRLRQNDSNVICWLVGIVIIGDLTGGFDVRVTFTKYK